MQGEELTTAIELYNTLVELGRFDEAFSVYQDRIDEATFGQPKLTRQRVELLERLFPNGVEGPTRSI